jgi:hypothetical protein
MTHAQHIGNAEANVMSQRRELAEDTRENVNLGSVLNPSRPDLTNHLCWFGQPRFSTLI